MNKTTTIFRVWVFLTSAMFLSNPLSIGLVAIHEESPQDSFVIPSSSPNWSQDIRLTFDSQWSIWPSLDTGPQGKVNLAWISSNDIQGGELHFMKVDRTGNILINDTKVTEMSTYSKFPEITVDSSGNVHTVWIEGEFSQSEISYAMMDSNGSLLIGPTQLSYNKKPSFSPFVDTDSLGHVHIVWREGGPSDRKEILYSKLDPSLDDQDGSPADENIISIVNDKQVELDAFSSRIVIDSQDRIHLSYTKEQEIWYEMIDHNGDPLIDGTRLTFATGLSANPSLTFDSGGLLSISWNDKRLSPYDVIYYTKIDPDRDDQNGDSGVDSNLSVIDDFQISKHDENFSNMPTITSAANGSINIVWTDSGVPNYVYRSRLDSGGNVDIDSELVNTISGHVAISQSHVVDSAIDLKDRIYITWWDDRDGQDEIYFKYTLYENESEPNQPPVANSGGPYIGQEGTAIPFDGSGSTDPEGGTMTFTWDFDSLVDSDGDGNFINDVDATGPTSTHTYYDNSNYTVTLTVTDDSRQSDTSTSMATILNVAPTAEADGPFEGNEPHTVQFTGTFTDPGTLDTHAFQWDFDFDGITFDVDSTQQNPTHQWLDDFNGTVAFKVTDDDGGWDTDVTHVTVNNLPPNATANGPYNNFEGTPIQFTGNHTDPGPLDTHTYEWDFSYDGTTFNSEATGNPYQNTWYDDHTGNIALRVTDDDGGWDLDVATVTIVNVPPIANAGDDKEDYEVSTFTFNGSFYDPGAGDTHTYEWDFDYDGISFDTDATGQTASHTWTDDFDGLIALRVTDDDGGSDIDTAHVLVKNVPPTVALEVLPIEVDAFLRIAGEKWHDVSIELFEDGILIANGTLVRYPGSPDEQMLDLSNLQFDYSKKYTATVTYTPDDDPINGQLNGANPCWIILRFDDGQELWLHHTFNVNHPDTYVWELDLTAAILSHGMTFEATAFDPGADELAFHWNFGDGTNVTNIYLNPNGTYPVSIVDTVTHTFPGSGAFTITVTVEDDDGGIVQISYTLTI